MLEIARAFAKAPQKPARSIYFAFVTAEESGLLGSAFLAANPPLPIDKIAANINIDGVNYLGATKDMVQLGSERSSIGPMIEAILKERGRTLTGDNHPERGYFFRSDHFSFAKLGVPAISLSEPKDFTGPNAADLLKKQEAYNDKDYHQPTDQYDPSWDFSGGVDDMRRWITTSAVWAGPFTIGTGIKTKLLEAMATNTPAVVTPVGGRGLDLASGTFLVGSSDEEVAAHLCSVLDDDELARVVGERGGDYVLASYDWPAVGRALERVYEEVVDEKRVPAG